MVVGQERRYYKEVDSTNTKAKLWAKAGAKTGSLVIADRQTAGRGRNGRDWHSPSGVGIWMSVLLRPEVDVVAIPRLSLVAGLAIVKAVQAHTGLDAKIKWPNDVVINGKKVCGVLCEMQGSGGRVDYAVVGVGMNVNTEAFPESLPYASSLYVESGIRYDREVLIEYFCNYFDTYYKAYQKEGKLIDFIEEYKNNCINLNNKVKILEDDRQYEAYATDINDKGHLIVQQDDGTITEVFVGEVSVRGLYGYVE